LYTPIPQKGEAVLTKVTVVPPPGAFWPSLEIPVQASDGSGVFAENVGGLEPVTAEIVTKSYNELDGDFVTGSRLPKRNIVLHLVMEAINSTISEVRQRLYGYFLPKMPIVLQFDFNDREPVRINGYVESFTSDRFSQDPTAELSILCPKPNFLSITEYDVNGSSVIGSNPPLTDVPNLGDQVVGFQLRISNPSDVDFRGDIHVERMIEGSTPGEYFSTQKMWFEDVDLSSTILDYIFIETTRGKKTAKHINPNDDGDTYSLLGMTTEDSSWPVLWAATNKFRVVTTNTTGWAGSHLHWDLTYHYEFGGI
jgi:hypothetical protein